MESIGIITYSNRQYEWMIPWWTHHIKAHSPLPIAFIDNGLSKSMHQWCKDQGSVIDFEPSIHVKPRDCVSKELQTHWESNYFGSIWDKRPSWFVKPQALLASPFDLTLFLDVDCEVKRPLFSLFESEDKMLFSLCEEQRGEAAFNSGVILYHKESPILNRWKHRCQFESHLFMGDEDLLSDILKKETHHILDATYNCRSNAENAQDAHIIHHVGLGGKRDIMASMIEQMQSG